MSDTLPKPPAKRRRVRFTPSSPTAAPPGDAATPSSSTPLSSSPKPASHSLADGATWNSAPPDPVDASLLHDPSLSHAVTRFDISEEMRDSTLSGEDGFVPNALVEDEAASTSSSDTDLDRDSQEDQPQHNRPLVPDAIASVASALRADESASTLRTEAAHALSAAGIGHLSRDELLASVRWCLRWGDSGVHGPFTADQMRRWATARYFTQPNRPACVRPQSGHCWLPARDVFYN